jgi:hypothetical protein
MEMWISIVSVLAAGATAMLMNAFSAIPLVQRLFRRLLGTGDQPQQSYSERLSGLTASLKKASLEVDSVISEMALVARHRETAVRKLETDVEGLESREKEMKGRIEALEKTPLPVAQHFAKLLESREKRNARRDYVLFGAGVVSTTVITIIIQVAFIR